MAADPASDADGSGTAGEYAGDGSRVEWIEPGIPAAADTAEEGSGDDGGGSCPGADPGHGGRTEVEGCAATVLVGLGAADGERGAAVVGGGEVVGAEGGELGDAQEGVGHDGDNRGVAKSGEGAVGGCSGGDGVGLVPLDAAGLAATAVVSGAAEAGEGGLGGGQGEIDAAGAGCRADGGEDGGGGGGSEAAVVEAGEVVLQGGVVERSGPEPVAEASEGALVGAAGGGSERSGGKVGGAGGQTEPYAINPG